MSPRRLILGIIALGGLIMLLLGLAGVFSPERLPLPPKEPEATSSDTQPAGAQEFGFKEFRYEGKTWLLTAHEGELDPERGVRLSKPHAVMWRETTEGKQEVEADADSGIYSRDPEQSVEMSGNVRLKMKGDINATLSTEYLKGYPDVGKGKTPENVQLSVETKEGLQVITGRGAEVVFKERTARVEEAVRMELAGNGAILSAPAAAQGTTETPPQATIITARGPVSADGFKRTIVFENDVVLTQGESRLVARRVEAQFTEALASPERFTAVGDVRFNVTGAEGRGDRLVRANLDTPIVLEGSPAVIKQGTSEIQSTKIEMNVDSGSIFVPAAGSLHVVQPQSEQSPSKEMNASWTQSMQFNRDSHQAIFRGDIRFAYGTQVIQCRILTVRFDEQNQTVIESRAEEDVRVVGDAASFSPSSGKTADSAEPVSLRASSHEMVYLPQQGSIVFTGDAEVTYGVQTVSGGRIELLSNGGALRVTGPGQMDVATGADGTGDRLKADWTGGMQYDRDTRRVVFNRAVNLNYGGRILHADTVTATLTPENTLDGLKAEGDVFLKEVVPDTGDVRTLKADRVITAGGTEKTLREFEAVGNVTMNNIPAAEGQGGHTVTADRIVSQSGPDGKVQALDGTGQVVITEHGGAGSGERTLKADHVIASVGADNTLKEFNALNNVVINEVPRDKDKASRQVTADRVVTRSDETGRLQAFDGTGRVVVTEMAGTDGKVRTLRADEMTAVVGTANEMERFDAKGKVVFEEEGMTATGTALTWNVRDRSGVLTGSPVEMVQGRQRLLGDRIEISENGERVRITSDTRVRATLIPSEGQSFGSLMPLK